MKRIAAVILLLLSTVPTTPALAAHKHPESYYQRLWCNTAGGVTEVRLDDGARVDCLTDEYAVEFDFAPKWAEAIGQALYYSIKTGKKPGIVLILEGPGEQYVSRLKAVAEMYSIQVWIVE